ncbi:MAG: hypothetical protein HC871_00950 [Rhizobiales bacterium]|nr:hypothetical protein [Hyphomicrobiales bacterium]
MIRCGICRVTSIKHLRLLEGRWRLVQDLTPHHVARGGSHFPELSTVPDAIDIG